MIKIVKVIVEEILYRLPIKIHTMKIDELDMADKSLVRLEYGINSRKLTSHCKLHGAMNVVAKYKDGSFVWRCVSTYGKCRAGCVIRK